MMTRRMLFARMAVVATYRWLITRNQVPNGIPHGIDQWGRPLW